MSDWGFIEYAASVYKEGIAEMNKLTSLRDDGRLSTTNDAGPSRSRQRMLQSATSKIRKMKEEQQPSIN